MDQEPARTLREEGISGLNAPSLLEAIGRGAEKPSEMAALKRTWLGRRPALEVDTDATVTLKSAIIGADPMRRSLIPYPGMLMQLDKSEWATLVAHASTPSEATRGIDARASVDESGAALFRYVLRAEISSVRIPSTKSAERADGLWKHTCFEAFIQAPGAAGYYELNFAPSLDWAVYRFKAYREGLSSPNVDMSLDISVRRFADRLELDAAVCLDDLTALQGTPRLRVGLSAVVEEQNGTLSYWALKHAPGKADFHRADGFVLELAT